VSASTEGYYLPEDWVLWRFTDSSAGGIAWLEDVQLSLQMTSHTLAFIDKANTVH